MSASGSDVAYRIAAEAVVVVHFAFLAYVVGGGFLAWKWRPAFWPHLAALRATQKFYTGNPRRQRGTRDRNAEARSVAVGQRSAAWGLTVLRGVTGGFIDHYVENVLYPERDTPLVQALALAVVALSWTGVLLRWRARRRPSAHT